MEVISYGVSKVEFGTFDTATGAITSPVEIPAFKDSVDNQEEDAPETPFYQEGKASPRRVVYGQAKETFKLSIMDSGAAMAAKFIGGTVTTVETNDTWHKGTSKAGTAGGFRFTTTDGCVCTVYGAFVAKRNNKMSDSNIRLIDITITPIETGTAIASVVWADPEV